MRSRHRVIEIQRWSLLVRSMIREIRETMRTGSRCDMVIRGCLLTTNHQRSSPSDAILDC
jgi:hypothetical protein